MRHLAALGFGLLVLVGIGVASFELLKQRRVREAAAAAAAATPTPAPETAEERERRIVLLAERAPTIEQRRDLYAELLRSHPDNDDYRRKYVAARDGVRASTAAAAEAARRAYATTLRTAFLDRGMDIKVRVSGARAERLELTYALFNDVWLHHFQEGDLFQEVARLGFREIDLRDGYDYAMRVTVSP